MTTQRYKKYRYLPNNQLIKFHRTDVNYILKDRNISITNAQWIEMGNGAIRLTAELDGIPFKRTFAKTSTEAKNMMDLGGIKMSMEQQQEYVNKYFVPKYLELYSDKE